MQSALEANFIESPKALQRPRLRPGILACMRCTSVFWVMNRTIAPYFSLLPPRRQQVCSSPHSTTTPYAALAPPWHRRPSTAATLTQLQGMHLRTHITKNGLQALQVRHTYSQNL